MVFCGSICFYFLVGVFYGVGGMGCLGWVLSLGVLGCFCLSVGLGVDRIKKGKYLEMVVIFGFGRVSVWGERIFNRLGFFLGWGWGLGFLLKCDFVYR